MPYVERALIIRAAPRDVYEVAKDPEAFPQFMPDVKTVRVLRRGDGWCEAAWEAVAAGRTFRWTERDEYDDEACRIRYRQVAGDLKKFEGEWRFLPHPEGTEAVLTVDFDLGIPMLAALLNPVLVKVVEMNCDNLLGGIRRRVESRPGAGQAGSRA